MPVDVERELRLLAESLDRLALALQVGGASTVRRRHAAPRRAARTPLAVLTVVSVVALWLAVFSWSFG